MGETYAELCYYFGSHVVNAFLSLCLILSFENIWLTFVIGIPAQIIIALWSRLKSTKLGTIIQRASKNQSSSS